MNAPASLYALGLVVLMDRQNVHHFEIDLDALDETKSQGLSIDFVIEGRKVTVSTGRCDCPKCAAAVGSA